MHLLLADENFDADIVTLLTDHGHDIVTLRQLSLDNLGLPDEDLLTVATNLNRAIVTFNRKDFIKLHRKHPNHAGIIVCTKSSNYQRLAEKIDEAIAPFANLSGLLIRVYRDQQ